MGHDRDHGAGAIGALWAACSPRPGARDAHRPVDRSTWRRCGTKGLALQRGLRRPHRAGKALQSTRRSRSPEPFDAVSSRQVLRHEWAAALGSSTPAAERDRGRLPEGINDERVRAVVGRERTLGCVIRSAPTCTSPATRCAPTTGRSGSRSRAGRQGDEARPDARQDHERRRSDEGDHDLFGSGWSKLSVNCMANPLPGSPPRAPAEVRTQPGAAIPIFVAPRRSRSGGLRLRSRAHHGIAAQRLVDAYEGRGFAESRASRG